MAKGAWTWDPSSRRFRDTKTGEYISHAEVARLRDEFAATQRSWADQGARRLANGDWTVRRWEREVRARLKRIYTAEYLLGRGGRKAATAADYARIGEMLVDQYRFLRNFALDVQAGRLTEAQIAARTQLYHTSAVQAFERGKAAAYSPDLILPGYPADGRTICRSSCRCRWLIRETKTLWRAYWKRSSRESCPDCEVRARIWNPYTQPKV